MTTDSSFRAEYIAGLRRLAAFLADNPDVPVPNHGTEINLFSGGTERERRAAVDRFAELTGAPVSDGTHYQAVRDFGPIALAAVAISDERRSRHDAWMSYADAITP
ncbi:hypothetical protein GCM10009677_57500 [Sphaerisporangium rubeum]|uniref:Uncharacterized protein n=1 Tax=Sphaerisporangium rubeum TaxID=321317 RepID=A0A7X0M8T1_9ACTN|nr:hypothetical protein [Sphaerisporangium rubeum]MBB6474334.1 hypothetical protein [Sphaerisporangium rubeum]